jgi:ATP-dependent phosphofructokinase / diphosphate-dependent phosphofructokinase
MTKRIGILSAGGDCPGSNAVIASVVKVGVKLGYEFIGFERGLEGILEPMSFRELNLDEIKGISYLGGTILRTSNKGRFASKVGEGEANRIPEEILLEAKKNLDNLGVEGLIIIGGDGTLSSAMQLAEYGINIVGVPKTIDNDLSSTDQTFGYSSAVTVAVDALDKIHTTATSHERTFIVECMGRSAGWIALGAGLAGGANAILLPEFDYSVDDLVDFIRHRRENRRRSTVIVIAEGAKVDQEAKFNTENESEVHYLGVSEELKKAISRRAPDEFELRTTILGHTQRGGAPNAEDRILSKRYGVVAMEAYHEGKFGHMVCLRNGIMGTTPLGEATSAVKRVTPDVIEYQTARKLGVFIH